MKLSYALIILVLFAGGCSRNAPAGAEDSSHVAANENDAKFANKKQENDARFLVDATDLSREALLLGNLAKVKGNDTSVQGVGKLMIEAHTKALKEVTDLAKAKMVTIPDSANHDAYTLYADLEGKNGNEFAKMYCQHVIDGYKKAIATFEKESTDSRDQDIKEWASTMLPQLRSHLDRVFECQKRFEKI